MAARAAVLFGVAAARGQHIPEAGGGGWSAFEKEVIEHHSLTPPFIQDWWQGGVRYWDFGGDTVVTDKYVRLTPAKQDRDGWLWNDIPNDIDEWELTVGFRLHGKGSADGLALWYVENPFKTTGHLWGSPDKFKGIGVIFDTYDNDNQRDNPAVTVIQNDGTKGGSRDPWDLDNDLKADRKIHCQWDYRTLADDEQAVVRIEYKRQTLDLWMSKSKIGHVHDFNNDDATHCGEWGVHLPKGYYFGASATTGHLADYQDIHFFHVTPAEGVHLEREEDGPGQDHKVHDPIHDNNMKAYWKPKTPEQVAEEKRREEAEQAELAKATEQASLAGVSGQHAQGLKVPHHPGLHGDAAAAGGRAAHVLADPNHPQGHMQAGHAPAHGGSVPASVRVEPHVEHATGQGGAVPAQQAAAALQQDQTVQQKGAAHQQHPLGGAAAGHAATAHAVKPDPSLTHQQREAAAKETIPATHQSQVAATNQAVAHENMHHTQAVNAAVSEDARHAVNHPQGGAHQAATTDQVIHQVPATQSQQQGAGPTFDRPVHAQQAQQGGHQQQQAQQGGHQQQEAQQQIHRPIHHQGGGMPHQPHHNPHGSR